MTLPLTPFIYSAHSLSGDDQATAQPLPADSIGSVGGGLVGGGKAASSNGGIRDAELPEIHEFDVALLGSPRGFCRCTLVHLARREAASTVFTVDYSDFETYRIDGRRRFRVLSVRKP